MKKALYWSLGFIMVGAALWAEAVQSPLLLVGMILLLGFVLLTAFFAKLKRHPVTSLIRSSVWAACCITLALIVAGYLIEVCVPVARTKAMGIEGHNFFIMVDKGRRNWLINT